MPVLVLVPVPMPVPMDRMQNARITPPGLPSQRKSGQPFPMNESHLHPTKALERNGVAMRMVDLAEAEAVAEEEAVTEEEEEAVAEEVASNCSDPIRRKFDFFFHWHSHIQMLMK
jgi:hypothetical protein